LYKKSDKAELTVRDKMQLILDIGQLMMENGASSKRVVRDMLRAAAYLGIYWENVQIHITYSTIMINVDDGVTSETMFRKCYKHGVNMMTTLLANQLSWDALKSNESYLIYRNQMMTIQQMARKRLYPQWLTLFCIGMASSAFCLLFGGHWYEALYTFIAAVVGCLRQDTLRTLRRQYLHRHRRQRLLCDRDSLPHTLHTRGRPARGCPSSPVR
jgi:uncharacterized membrane protein YjjP (DUF1212 family)